jgi:sugar fermentation stimulation protein A
MGLQKRLLYSLPKLYEGRFITRDNRFAGLIEFQAQHYSAHIHDPGRLKELLINGRKVLFNESNGKLDFYIRAVRKDSEWILLDSAQHSKIAKKLFEILPEFSDYKTIKSEVPLGNSRIDFMLDSVPLEVKGVTLVKNDIALFPDAPTARGRRHVEEIIKYNGMLLFLIFRNAHKFGPYKHMDPQFAKKLSEARKQGIDIIPIHISFDGKNLFYENRIALADF